MRKKIIAGNWKMYKTPAQAKEYFEALLPMVQSHTRDAIVVFPSDTSLAVSVEAVHGTNVRIGAQNMHWMDEGAYTGQISPLMLNAVGTTHVLLGHSEIRTYNAEIDESVNLKIRAALKHGIVPMLCIGESLEQREADLTKSVLLSQLGGCLAGLTPEEISKIVVAYEPVWAIGTGKVASPEQAEEAHIIIRTAICHGFEDAIADGIRILYGGSVKPDNIASLMKMPNIDGALIGGASLKPADFASMVNYVL